MRWQSFIVLMTIVVSTVTSPILPLTIAYDRETMIGVLNACHSVTSALSSNGEIPCVNERSRSRVFFHFVASSESPQFFLMQILMPKMNEPPPKA